MYLYEIVFTFEISHLRCDPLLLPRPCNSVTTFAPSYQTACAYNMRGMVPIIEE